MSEKGNRERRTARRRIRTGFPWAGSFNTIDEARSYVAGDKIQCLMCGNYYLSLCGHLKIHDIAEGAYKLRFGIPYGIGLQCSSTFVKHQELARKTLTSFDFLAALERARESLRVGGVEYRPRCEAVISPITERLRKINESGSVIRPCACGNTVSVSGSRVFYPDEMIRCEQCLFPEGKGKMTAKDRDKLKRWSEDNPDRSREYFAAKNWWGWQKRPLPLLEYAKKWGARLHILQELLDAAKAQ